MHKKFIFTLSVLLFIVMLFGFQSVSALDLVEQNDSLAHRETQNEHTIKSENTESQPEVTEVLGTNEIEKSETDVEQMTTEDNSLSTTSEETHSEEVDAEHIQQTPEQEKPEEILELTEDNTQNLSLNVAMQSGTYPPNSWYDLDGKRYFANADGLFYKNQIITFGNIGYYMGEDGSVQYGFINYNGNLYYANPDQAGAIKLSAGWLTVDGKYYFSDVRGQLYKDRFIYFGDAAYYMGSDGSKQLGITKAANGLVYRLDETTGELIRKSGWYELDGKRYFAQENGIPYTKQLITFGDKAYYMGSDGTIQKGLIDTGNIEYYADPTTGLLVRGPKMITLEGKQYLINSNYRLAKGLVSFDGKQYYFDPSTQLPNMQKNKIEQINGVYYRINEYGHANKIDGISEDYTYSNVYIYGNRVATRYVGGDHIVLSLNHQMLFLYRNHRLVIATPVVSGYPTMATPTGQFRINAKERSRYLVGADYRSWVEYWMPIYGQVGIHDATWQRPDLFYYDSKSYQTYGSHGCVNIEPSQMPIVYANSYVGMPVTVYK